LKKPLSRQRASFDEDFIMARRLHKRSKQFSPRRDSRQQEYARSAIEM
jgi:hypothetical protein